MCGWLLEILGLRFATIGRVFVFMLGNGEEMVSRAYPQVNCWSG